MTSFWFLLLMCAALAQEPIETDETSSEGSREVRTLEQDWRALDHFSPTNVDNNGWIPQQTSSENQEEQPRRRRIRKRKRRPSANLTDNVPEERPRRRKRPQRLDFLREPWEETISEDYQRPVNRKRITPFYPPVVDEEPQVYEKIRDPFTALEQEEIRHRKKQEDGGRQVPDLKTLLKQTNGTLSLSEILQQKNLSLAELLKGNQRAISALTENSNLDETTAAPAVLVTVTDFAPVDSTKYKRLPPSVGMVKKITDRHYETAGNSREELSPEEILEAQRKRMSLLKAHKESKLFTDVTKFEVVTEPTTERRIFVPSNSKLYTSVDYKPDTQKYELITDQIETTVAPITTVVTTVKKTFSKFTFKPKYRTLPVTNAKLSKLFSKPVMTTLPPKAVKIDISEIFGFTIDNNNVKNNDAIDNEPFRMTIDLDSIVQNNVSSTIAQQVTTSTTPLYVAEKLKHVTAKEEIMEILKNPSEREQLSKVLKLRNMTIDELVEQRERGSSQLHLADIFHNKTREPEPRDEPFVGQMSQDYFNNAPMFNRQQKSRPLSESAQPVLKTENKKKPEIITPTPKDLYTITSFPTYKIENTKDLKSQQPFLPIWKDLYPNLFSNIFENNHQDNKVDEVKFITSTSTMSYDNIQRLEELDNNFVESNQDRLDVDLFHKVSDTNDMIILPSGVKSAIVASFAIVGLSLLVFLTIFVIFRWSQKQKRRFDYGGTLSGSKIKSPILEQAHKRSLRTIMCETLGKKKGYYKSQFQSMSDSIWDNDKKSYM